MRMSGKQATSRALTGTKNYLPFSRVLSGFGWNNLGFYQAVNYYERISVIATIVDMIAEAFGQLTPILQDKETGEVIIGSDLMKLLSNPNTIEGYTSFAESLASFYMITGNCYIEAIGNSRYAPIEIYSIPSQFVSIMPAGDGQAGTMIVGYDSGGNSTTFNRIEQTGKRNRFVDNMGLKELWQIRRFSPRYGAGNLFGQSKFTSAYYEIELFEQSRIHNYSILKNGSRPSGILMNKDTMDDDSYNRIREQLNGDYSGAENAGKVFLVEGLNGDTFKFEQLSLNNKDMEFMALNKDCIERICNRGGLPLPLVMPDASTYNNVANAVLFLYDNTILPLANKLFEEMSQMLLPRFKYDTERYQISFDPEEVTALKLRTMEQLKLKKEIGVLTFNEIRGELGLEPIDDIGDSIVPAGNPTNSLNDPNAGQPANNGFKRGGMKSKVEAILRKALAEDGDNENKTY